MAQKSLSVLHRIDTSMTWDIRVFNKKYKWFSYILWFFYTYLYKKIFFLEQDSDYLWYHLHNPKSLYIQQKQSNYVYPSNLVKRFSYFISLYCLEFLNYVIILNIFFQINLSTLNQKRFIRKKKKNISFF